ncbi:MAG: TIGR01906 family membrane protein [Candidatus Limivivens sp.]|nr:TIGR01906 family membrane protein [Candidatus Limivivens sp.]
MKQKTFTRASIFLGLLGTLFILSLSVTLTLNACFLYYQDLDKLSADSGLSVSEIRSNYDALIDYNSFLNQEELVFPTLPMSEEGRIHFAEVKRIFVFLQYCCIISGIFFLAGSILSFRRKQYGFLFTTWMVGTTFPILVGLLAAGNWDWFFVTFHKLLFRNDYWLFNPATDPIIDLLPDSYFFRCLLVIVLLMIVLTQGCGLLYRHYSHGHRQQS